MHADTIKFEGGGLFALPVAQSADVDVYNGGETLLWSRSG